jgi:hypothetical protein
MFAPLMGRRRSNRAAYGVACTLAALALPACGGGERQDADEPHGAFKVDVAEASFPPGQSISQKTTMRIRVRNSGTRTVPNVAMTVKTRPKQPGGAPSAFGQTVDDPRLADPDRPIWIVDKGPEGGDTSYTNTWALGRLAPGQSKTFSWSVTPVQAGRYVIDYEVAPGLDGKARLAAGSRGKGTFRVAVDDTPADARVGADGEVIR